MSTGSTSLTAALLEFLERLERQRISYHLQHTRPESIMVCVAVPGERWEVEFLDDGEVEVERFRSDGQVAGAETLDSLFDLHGTTPASEQSNN